MIQAPMNTANPQFSNPFRPRFETPTQPTAALLQTNSLQGKPQCGDLPEIEKGRGVPRLVFEPANGKAKESEPECTKEHYPQKQTH
jgi:hypothetical protein